jgi:hypothetical protein
VGSNPTSSAILHIASQDPDYAEVMEAFRAADPLQSAA